MDITFWKGVFMGILIALPTGAVSFLIIRRMYLFGMKSGMYSVIGSMISDLFYAVIVGFGLKIIQEFLTDLSGYVEIIAGLALIVTGYRAYRETPQELSEDLKQNHPLRDVTSIALLNLLNPALILSFTTIFIILGMGHNIGHPKLIITFLIGISVGTLLFWYLAGRQIVRLRKVNRPDMVQKFNQISGIVLAIIGVILILLSIVKIVFN